MITASREFIHEPDRQGSRDGKDVLELIYDPRVRTNGPEMLLGESKYGKVFIFEGSIQSKIVEKRRQGRVPDLTDAQLLENISTYTAKHEILYHHTGNFILRNGRRFNIVDDEYTRDGYLESNNPVDIERNVPTRLSPQHPFIKEYFGK